MRLLWLLLLSSLIYLPWYPLQDALLAHSPRATEYQQSVPLLGYFATGNVLALAGLLATILLLGQFAWRPGARANRVWLVVAFVVFSLALVLTQSRTSYLLLGVSVVLLTFSGHGKAVGRILVAAVLLVATLALVDLSGWQVEGRVGKVGLEMVQSQLQSVTGEGGLESARGGVDQRKEWVSDAVARWAASPSSQIAGMGFGQPLTNFMVGGADGRPVIVREPHNSYVSECASPDACATDAISAMKSDQDAWRALTAVSTHTYNMGANSHVESLIVGTGKQYWMTEAGRALPREIDALGKRILLEEEPGDTAEAATTAARFLNDMNHSVTHWIWAIGIGAYDQHPNKDSGQVLARPDDASGGIKYNSKYYYLKQIRQTFDLGAAFFESISTKEGRMNWGYGDKPAITVAAARNPDGSWGVGVVNTTGLRSSKIARFRPATTWLVEVQLPADAPRGSYRVTRSHAHGSRSEGVLSRGVHGVLQVRVGPHELVTLRSQ